MTPTDEQLDQLARALIPSLDRIADRQTTTTRPYSCEVYRCHRPASHTGWVLYFNDETDAAPITDTRALCRAHTLEYEAKHNAGLLHIAGRPAIRFQYKWGLA